MFPQHFAEDVTWGNCKDQVEQEGQGCSQLGRLVGDARESEFIRPVLITWTKLLLTIFYGTRGIRQASNFLRQKGAILD